MEPQSHHRSCVHSIAPQERHRKSIGGNEYRWKYVKSSKAARAAPMALWLRRVRAGRTGAIATSSTLSLSVSFRSKVHSVSNGRGLFISSSATYVRSPETIEAGSGAGPAKRYPGTSATATAAGGFELPISASSTPDPTELRTNVCTPASTSSRATVTLSSRTTRGVGESNSSRRLAAFFSNRRSAWYRLLRRRRRAERVSASSGVRYRAATRPRSSWVS